MTENAPYQQLLNDLAPYGAQLVAVSKTYPAARIQALYNQGQRHFGENKVQEMCEKQAQLPADVRWHLIGHLQSNKVKYIAPFVHLIHSVDSWKLLQEIDKRAAENGRSIDVLLQVHIAEESTKFGFSAEEIMALLEDGAWRGLANVRICGLMGMATYTDNEDRVRAEFASLSALFQALKTRFFTNADYFKERSMGMSDDYRIALQEGSTMVRVGSLLFGRRG